MIPVYLILFLLNRDIFCCHDFPHQESATKKKRVVASEYQYMRDLLTREELDTVNAMDQEVESGQTKIRGLMAKFTENIDNMNKAKEDIHSLLSQTQTMGFLQVGR